MMTGSSSLAVLFQHVATWQVIAVFVVAVLVLTGVNILVGRYLNDAEPETDPAQVPVRSVVATPRPKRIQPVEADALAKAGPSPFSETVTEIPADSLAASNAPLTTSKKTEEAISQPRPTPIVPAVPLNTGLIPAMASAEEKPVVKEKKEERASIPLIVDSKVDALAQPVVTPPAPAAIEPVKMSEPLVVKMPETTASKVPAEPIKVPDLSKPLELAKPAELPIPREPSKVVLPAADKPLILSPLAEPKSTSSLPASASSISNLMSENKLAVTPSNPPAMPKLTEAAKPEEKPMAPVERSKEPIAVTPPVLVPAIPEKPLVASVDLIDVKKPTSPLTDEKPTAPSAGLILTPTMSDSKSVPATGVSVPPVSESAKPVEPKEKAPATPETSKPTSKVEIEEESSKAAPRPRIFMPANLPADAPAKLAPVPTPIVVPAAAEAVPMTPAPLAKSEPAVPVAPTPTTSVAKEPPKSVAPPAPATAKPEAKIPEPAKLEAAKPAPLPIPVPVIKAPVADEKPVAPRSEVPPPLPVPVSRKEIPSEDGTPAAPLVEPPVPTGSLVAPSAPALVSKPVAPVAEVPAAAKPTPVIAPVPVPAVVSAPTPPVPISVPPPVSISKPAPNMATTDTTTTTSGAARAAAQLTLGFEITSLQLTPFFKLGAVQLRPLSNIVSLHLIASQATENPLAAGISFQIVTVELDGESHLKSLLLKPLPNAQQAATPSPKLQVDAVNITQAAEGAPITISSSDQTSTAVQLLANFVIAAMDFTPSFEIGSLRLEPTSNSVLLRLAPSQRPAALDLPPSFEVANVQLAGDSQISGMRLTPGTAALKGA